MIDGIAHCLLDKISDGCLTSWLMGLLKLADEVTDGVTRWLADEITNGGTRWLADEMIDGIAHWLLDEISDGCLTSWLMG
jgi:hypothetical protein